MGDDAARGRPHRASSPWRFGASKAMVRVAPGQNEAQVLLVMRALLGRPRASLLEAANLGGAPDDALVEVDIVPRHGRRVIRIGAENTSVNGKVLLYHRFDGAPIPENEQIDVVEGRRGRGIGTVLLARQVEQARRLGIVEIQGYAARNDTIGDVGYMVWPLLGFDGILPHDILGKLPPALSGASSLSNLIETEEGRKWWLEHGDSIAVSFDLAPHSRAVRWLSDYLRRKGRS